MRSLLISSVVVALAALTPIPPLSPQTAAAGPYGGDDVNSESGLLQVIDLAGEWSMGGQPTFVEQRGDRVTFINEHGQVAGGRILTPTLVIADGWGYLRGTVANRGTAIYWENGTVWFRTPY